MSRKIFLITVGFFISINYSVVNAQSCCGTPGRSKALAKYVERQNEVKEGKKTDAKENNNNEKSSKPKSKKQT